MTAKSVQVYVTTLLDGMVLIPASIGAISLYCDEYDTIEPLLERGKCLDTHEELACLGCTTVASRSPLSLFHALFLRVIH